ncbi:3-isopropylmalate dehydratase small subunit [Trinickia soli]|uniref:3-isopropylmalate dehydratase small subunit n=1 Tax=Trinickia soli TaxID=380675 RepID=A0A2N7W1Y7_9BURK|nr:3-isopropylmalate dehydratase small subunit [Trinickia soli]KAA0088429.1 3-isopropylmalate dehydratase small subunit [Paraburkholderia sp. T12-10]PMS23438.1 3-isopropylmalate dehydratase small subunit [Trinickia soli]CAB3708209.1 3-isopropylmalate dehydratase small subunit [Trinickia soli]
MEKFVHLDAVALPIAQSNFDTDQILPARYLQKPRSDDFGTYLFRDLRYRADGTENEHFVLNAPAYRPARIVVANENFACGSSREHAVWALFDYGVRAVIAPSVGDIFASNASKNGLLIVLLPAQDVAAIIRKLEAQPGLHVSVDLDAQIVSTPDGVSHHFDIDPYQKRCLQDGLDELGYTLTQLDRIEAFERDYAY